MGRAHITAPRDPATVRRAEAARLHAKNNRTPAEQAAYIKVLEAEVDDLTARLAERP